MPFNNGAIYDETFKLNVKVQIRDANDPEIYFLGQGGVWPDDERDVEAATAMTVIGGLFMIPCIFFAIIIVRKRREYFSQIEKAEEEKELLEIPKRFVHH
eukprot:TRINITY_DN15332_c0_g1_i2.p3 TRINITY_DN15332_c0_g1~~TRINITY_DN15332_c0_g1_i2.p3  ORF type:complete len:100 (-),score=33.72 TRINITY_DN15332_c0_g1_i2:77-376(-)